MKKIILLTTGGTIAGVNIGKSEKYKAGALSAEEILKPIKEKLAEFESDFTVEPCEVCSMDSKNINETIWKKLYLAIRKFIAEEDVESIVITHGTDTLAETAFFLEYTLKTDKPIILTGAMRPATALSADGSDNLFRAILVAASPLAKNRGVLAVMNNEIHSAIDVTKTHKNNVAAFKSPNMGPVGIIVNDNPIFFATVAKFKHKIYRFNENITFTYIPIIAAFAGDSGELIFSAIKRGAKGIVYAGFGAGTYPDTVKKALDFAVKNNVKVMIASSISEGVVEVSDENFISAGFLSPQKARILLMLELCKKGA